MADLSYLRWPDVAGDVVSFVAEDDVWVAPLTGGRAWRVSADHAPASSPRLSPDGTQVAWTSTRENATEVFTAPVDGGTTRRLTWWGARTVVLGWLSGDELLVGTAAGEHSARLTVAVALPVAGGPARPLPWGRVGAAAVEPGGPGIVTSTPTMSEPAWRKRYRGGTASRLWLDRTGSGEFTRLLPDLTSSLSTPVWAGGRIGFTSDHEGTGQLWSLPAPAGGAGQIGPDLDAAVPGVADLHRHTDSEFYVRHASSDGTRVVWSSAGSLWTLATFDPASGAEPEPVAVGLGGPRTGRAPHRVPAKGSLGTTAPDRTGRASAIEVRGTVQWLPHRDGPVRVLAATPGVRARMPVVLGTTGRVAWVTDAGGEDAVQIAPVGVGTVPPTGTVPSESSADRLAEGALGTVLELVASPDGAVLAIAAHDGRVLTLDPATGAVSEVARTTEGDVSGLTFSPDSRWLAWSHPGPQPLAQIRLVELSGSSPVGEAVEVTPLRFTDTEPAFTADGEHLAFLSVRSLDPAYDAVVFDMNFAGGCRPYLVPLAATTPSPFDPSGQGRHAEPRTGAEELVDAASDVAAAVDAPTGVRGPATSPPRTTVDPAGTADRIRPFPVEAGSLTGLAAVDGGVVWLRSRRAGVLGDDRASVTDPPAKPVLERWSFDDRKVVELSPDIEAVRVSGDGRRLVVRSGDDLLILPADRPAPPHPEDGAGNSDTRLTVDLSRAGADVDPGAEWTQEYAEAGRRMRDFFWRADLDGFDWAGALDRYRPLVDAIASADDLVDLLWEVQGEFATSHAYVMPKVDPDPARAQGLLGADLRRDDDGTWRVGRVLPGESSDPRARSPLAAPGVGMAAGDALLAVAGRPVDPAAGPNALLVGTAGKPVELTVAPAGGGPARTVTVVPVDSETPLRYHLRVADRRDRTHELSQGRLGYVHVPDGRQRVGPAAPGPPGGDGLRRVGRRPPREQRRSPVRAGDREDRPPCPGVGHGPGVLPAPLPGRCPPRAGRAGRGRVRRVRRRHRQRRRAGRRGRAGRRAADVGRGDRHRRPLPTARRHHRHPAAVLVLVHQPRLGRGEPRRGPGRRRRADAAGLLHRARPPAGAGRRDRACLAGADAARHAARAARPPLREALTVGRRQTVTSGGGSELPAWCSASSTVSVLRPPESARGRAARPRSPDPRGRDWLVLHQAAGGSAVAFQQVAELPAAVTVRCLQTPDGSFPPDRDNEDLVAVVARAY